MRLVPFQKVTGKTSSVRWKGSAWISALVFLDTNDPAHLKDDRQFDPLTPDTETRARRLKMREVWGVRFCLRHLAAHPENKRSRDGHVVPAGRVMSRPFPSPSDLCTQFSNKAFPLPSTPLANSWSLRTVFVSQPAGLRMCLSKSKHFLLTIFKYKSGLLVWNGLKAVTKC